MSILAVENVSKVFADGKKALDNVSIQVQQGDFLALLGRNGAGKTTLINCITQMHGLTSGTIKVSGLDISHSPQEAKQHIGVVPQEFNFNIFETVEQVVLNSAGYFGVRRAEAEGYLLVLLERLQLTEQRYQQARFLSGGMKRRLMTARALIHRPKILIMDEPTAGVDIDLRHGIWEFLREINKEGTSIILTTHHLEEAQVLCEVMAIIESGKILKTAKISEIGAMLEHTCLRLELSAALPVGSLPSFSWDMVGGNEIRVILPAGISFNQLVIELAEHNVTVVGVTQVSNQLEDYFLQLTNAARSD